MTTARSALICSAALMLAAATAATAQPAWPTKPVRWIVPYAPGGGTDMAVRPVAQKLAEAWGHQVLVENRPGGGTNIGAEVAAKSAPDGYTLFAPGVANAINVTLFPKLNYDIVRDFAHITNLVKIPNILVVHPSVPAKNAKELVALAKARPNALRNGSPGIGSPQHLGGEIFKAMTGAQMVHVPYKGAAPALTDLVAGHIEVYFGAISSTMSPLRSGRVRPLGVTSLKRVEAVPEVPTLDEQGLKAFETASWIFASAPAGTPRDLVAKIHRDTVRALGLPDIRQRMAADGSQIVGDAPEAVTAFLKTEIEKWGKAVKASGAKPEG
jgi:tripartite-type tricarboxylate transporter receptor subunit TctC